ncbi:hypothetical protein AMTR_s00028p00137830 [Amborella trichopoda]|uniref:Uncharacterized protein n=1 Tax=Amborella trichopoda TaxID=13333 RepID=W1PRC0_AMBTC|nr:hypothetical protein AMTR_s00028p00137830 [Amborella trichopoda]
MPAVECNLLPHVLPSAAERVPSVNTVVRTLCHVYPMLAAMHASLLHVPCRKVHLTSMDRR